MLLRQVLLANGLFSGLSGVIAMVAAQPLAAWLGVGLPTLVLLIGGGLVVYGVALIVQARRTRLSLPWARIVVGLDLGWVLGSLVVLGAGWLSTVGSRTVAAVAGAVLLFAVLQSLGIRMLSRAR